MLQRIVSIKNVGQFRRCAAAGDVTFRRFTFIFAENGRGKTTLCAILRSLGTNRPGFVIGRTTLGSTERAEVQLLIGNVTFSFRNGTWSAPFPEIAVFDGTYVSDNVFAGDVVDTNQRRNLYRVIIGAQGVTLAGRLRGCQGPRGVIRADPPGPLAGAAREPLAPRGRGAHNLRRRPDRHRGPAKPAP